MIAPEVGEGLTLGEHGSTFAGGPICARAALAALEVLSDPAVLANVAARARSSCARSSRDIRSSPRIRGRGLMVGLALAEGVDAAAVAAAALAGGVVVNAPNPATIRLLPALTIGADDLGEGLARVRAALDAVAG